MKILEMVFFLAPIFAIIYCQYIYYKWKSHAFPSKSFSKDYWHTEKNPLNRSWLPNIACIVYLSGVLSFFVMGAV
jgi:hypothetical protein